MILLAKADSLTVKYFDVEATRGNICAYDESLLATSVPIFDIRMDVASPLISNADFNANIDELAGKLPPYLEIVRSGNINQLLTKQNEKKAIAT